MNKLLLFAVLFCSAVFVGASTTPDPANYPETLHVTSSYLQFGTPSMLGAQRLEVVTNGVKYMLAGQALTAKLPMFGKVHYGVLPIGDYKAKLIRDTNEKPDYLLLISYEILLPDGKTSKFEVVGQKE